VNEERERAVRAAFPALDRLRNERWRDAVVRVWVRMWDESEWDEPGDCPYNLVATSTDLVRHVNQVVEGALVLARVARESLGMDVDDDVIVAAGMVHDSSKLVEYEPGPEGPRTSELGRRLVHAEYAARAAAEEGLPPDVVAIVVNHTTASPEVPATTEALCVYYADMCAADLARLQAGAPLHVAGHKHPA
jgi:7,8-dihydroneopterin 2',3'-cyclic phosphate phosphodiesterase